MDYQRFFKKANYLLTVITGISLAILLFCISCENNNDPGDPVQPLVFSSLQAEKDTIVSGESTKITAIATGYKITFNWSASAGDILRSGAEVLYVASPCQAGKNKITCTVKDGNGQSDIKEIFIVVE